MSITEQDAQNFFRKVEHYHTVLANTTRYRQIWQETLKTELTGFLERLTTQAKLACTIQTRMDIQNLEAVIVSLGTTPSGLGEPIGDGLRRDLIKQNGSLVYQQLFNGKILVLINYPFIEKYGQPAQPKTVAVYRPEELKEPYILRHLEEFMTEITLWEDYDDDRPEPNQRIGFKLNFEQQQQQDGAGA